MESIVLSSKELLDKIIHALEHRLPCPVVSLGASETFVLAQGTVLSLRQVLRHAEAEVANRGIRRGQEHRGVRFPNLQARDELAAALKHIDIVGCNLLIRDEHSGLLTEKVLRYYSLNPTYTFEAYIRRVIMFSQKSKFEHMLSGRKIVIICGYADEVAEALHKNLRDKLRLTVTGAVKIHEFEEIPRVKKELQKLDFDLALLAAGLNAIILADYIANVLGKVAFDIGQGMESLITGSIVDEYCFLAKAIGLRYLFRL